MAMTIRQITLWRARVPHRPGALAEVLEPLAATGADLQVVMGYREHGSSDALIEVYPITGRKQIEAAESAGLSASGIPTVLAVGDNRPGLGHRIARALAEGGLNVAFLVAQVVGRKFSAVYGFETEADADRAAKLIRQSASPKR
jgi:hypothetical protein